MALYGLGVLGLLGPSPPAKSKSKKKNPAAIRYLYIELITTKQKHS
jgi:hypothetical protein